MATNDRNIDSSWIQTLVNKMWNMINFEQALLNIKYVPSIQNTDIEKLHRTQNKTKKLEETDSSLAQIYHGPTPQSDISLNTSSKE